MNIPDDALVLDVGGWAKPLPRADWVIDLLPYETRGLYGEASGEERFTAGTWVQRDICDRDPWPFADDQFDFAVCSHTLEDVRDPVGVCRELSRVAKAGYVELPAPVEELTWGIQGEWVGWTHHHWITELIEGELVFTAKPHLLCAEGRHLPRGAADGKERVIALAWEGTLRAREQVFVGAEQFDPWLQSLLDAHGGAAKPRRGRFRR
ncbi:MAG TPA: methyltransferase domain-containing protein [Solirubrobacteraceae bacterium]